MALTNCQADPSAGKGAGADTFNGAGLAAVPACAVGLRAGLVGGTTITYGGSDPRDGDLCVLQWSGRSHAFYYGFWSATSHSEMTDQARLAFRAALTGPVGTETAFEAQHARMWDRVTVTHVSNDTVIVAGEKRPALELKVVQHDAQGRPRVRAETHHWIDRATGVMLKEQTVTPMQEGGQMTSTTWEVASLVY